MGLGRGSWRDRAIYAAVWLALLAPMLLLVWGALTDDLGANPVERLIRQLGVWGLRFLILGLAITPAARLLRRPRLIRYRRTVGLFAFTVWGTTRAPIEPSTTPFDSKPSSIWDSAVWR